jgi:energy-coupling factor transporter ATP-binding protein EcfA2
MPNGFKYNTSPESLSLKEGNFYMSTNDVGRGPTSTTGFYNGITPPASGYTMYLNKDSNGPAIYVAYDDTELISLTNKIAGTSYSTVNECLNYYALQSDKVITNKECPAIITDGLILNLDASFTPSYPKNGTTWYDISSGGNNGTFVNGPSYSSSSGGTITFDGVDDTISISSNSLLNTSDGHTSEIWVKFNNTSSSVLIHKDYVYTIRRANSTTLQWADGTNWSYANWGNTSPSFTYNTSNLNKYYHIAVTKSGNVVTVFLDGVSIVQKTFGNSGVGGNTNTLYIGSYAGGNNFLNGSVSSARIYNRALSASEVLQNYNAAGFLGSQFNPANSAAAILAVNPSATDGYYWINTSLGPRQLYCIMSLGGWMGVTSEISTQTSNLSTTSTWETNTNRRLQSANSQILNVTVQESGCGSPTYYQLQSPSSVGINYTQTMLLIQRVSTIGQCSDITGGTVKAYYTGPEYTGTYTSNGMCLWSDGIFANGSAQDMTGLKLYWVMLSSGTNQSLRYQVQCAGGSGQHYHMWFVK